ncbi:hypothetical protein BKA93DRAFT_877266 [Sparassis latifolia]|uniref:Uncharacterized protein n=1 Tax=Sparassis crispa TaxID=139825 RepID=A0A401GL54_9APHY|nr:hypothetical protein SCP_0412900 [Sparassis crispa]GBE82903.1 hypothetical protein SCP_0412900 [Sparassis crispa]
MVLRIAGWVLTHDQVRTWLELGGRDCKNLELYELSGALKDWFEERHIGNMAPIPTDYPHGSKQPVIILTTRYYQDPAATVAHWKRFKERNVDRAIKRRVIKETGFKDDDLRWVTVVDPYFQYPVVYKNPRNYALWPETGRPPENDGAEKKAGGDKEVEKGDEEDGGKEEEAEGNEEQTLDVTQND